MVFVNYILAIVDYIKALVTYFRDRNDGKDVTAPDFNDFLEKNQGTTEPQE